MTHYFLHVKTFSRGAGSSVTKAAAYRAGERIKDERLGAVYDYRDRTDVAHAEILLPSELEGDADTDWARDRSVLWNAVQGSGRQKNSRLAREVLVLLPPELTPSQRIDLARRFSQELSDRYGNAVDFAVHNPRPTADQRHHHAHILMSCRQVGPDGVGPRTTLELSGSERHARGLGRSRDELLWMRERWAQVANESLREAGLSTRLDHRSYKALGIDREPQPRMPRSIFYAERRSGMTTPAGDEIRARHRERLEARRKGPDEINRVIERQKAEGRQKIDQAPERQPVAHKTPHGALTREELNRKRREYCKANAAEINRKQRERRRANADEVNRKQREYLRRRAEKVAANRLSNPEQSQARKPRVRATAAPSDKSSSRSTVPAVDESLQQWRAHRESQKDQPTESSLDQWAALRTRQKQGLSTAPPQPERSRTAQPAKAGRDEPSDSPPKRHRQYDHGV